MMMRAWGRGVVVAVAVLAAAGVAATPRSEDAQAKGAAVAVLRVDVDAAPGGDGSSWASAYTTLRDALAVATSGTEVWVAAGRYFPDEGTGAVADDRNSTFTLANGVRLLGGFAGDETDSAQRDRDANLTILSADIDGDDVVDADGVTRDHADIRNNNARHLLTAANAAAGTLIDGFTLTAGQATGSGAEQSGAILLCTGSSLMTLRDVTVIGATMDNRATLSGCTLDVAGSEFVNNRAGDVAAVSANSGTYVDTLFIGNESVSQGSIFYLGTGSLVLRNSAFVGNRTGTFAGVIRAAGATVTADNVLFSGNYGGGGAAMSLTSGSSATLRNVTISGNRAFAISSGGGIVFNSNGTLTIANSILWNNATLAVVGTYAASIVVSGGGTATATNSIVQGSGGSSAWNAPGLVDGGGNLAVDPMFVDAVEPPTSLQSFDGDLHLRHGSPALDAGANVFVQTATDLDGAARIQDDIVDLGAYEGAAPESDLVVAFAPDMQSTTAGTTRSWTLTVRNDGDGDATGITFADGFSGDLACAWTATANGGASGHADGDGSLQQTLVLPAGSEVVYSIECAVDGLASGTIAHTATAAVAANEFDTADNSATVSVEVDRVTDVEVTLAAASSVVAGRNFPLTVTARNRGPSTAPDAALLVDFADGIDCSWTTTPAGGAEGGNNGNGDAIDQSLLLPDEASITYAISCRAPASAVDALPTSVQIDASDADPDGSDDAAQATTPVTREADLAAQVDNGRNALNAGESVNYAIVFSNSGPSDAPGAHVVDVFPAPLEGCSWTCTSQPGSSCPAGPVDGDIDATIDLGANSYVTFRAICAIPSDASFAQIVNAASVSAPAGVTDANSANDVAEDVDGSLQVDIFDDGFEGTP